MLTNVWRRAGRRAAGSPGDLLDVELRPLEPGAQRRERFRHQMLVYFSDIEDRVVRINPLEVADNVHDRRLGLLQALGGLNDSRKLSIQGEIQLETLCRARWQMVCRKR